MSRPRARCSTHGQLDYLADGVGVFFDPGALGEDARSPWPAWRAHPLLFPFLHGQSGGVLHCEVPAESADRCGKTRFTSIETELTAGLRGLPAGGLGALELLLIELARLARDVCRPPQAQRGTTAGRCLRGD